MAENTFNTSITEEDPFNEDEVRTEFWQAVLARIRDDMLETCSRFVFEWSLFLP